jgi:serine/threonine protein kinase
MKAMDHMHRNGIFHRDIKVGTTVGDYELFFVIAKRIFLLPSCSPRTS